MFYQANARTAQVMGDSVEISLSSEVPIQRAIEAISSMSKADMIKTVSATVDKMNTEISTALLNGKVLFTSDVAQKIVDYLSLVNAELAYIMENFSGEGLSVEFPAYWKNIVCKQEDTSKKLSSMSTWNPSVGDIHKIFTQKRNEALTNLNLDSPYVGPNMKMLVIKMAYGQHYNSLVSEPIRNLYQSDGKPRSGTAVPSQSPLERLRFIESEYTNQGVETPDEIKAAIASVDAGIDTKGNTKGILALLVAGGIAFFALR